MLWFRATGRPRSSFRTAGRSRSPLGPRCQRRSRSSLRLHASQAEREDLAPTPEAHRQPGAGAAHRHIVAARELDRVVGLPLVPPSHLDAEMFVTRYGRRGGRSIATQGDDLEARSIVSQMDRGAADVDALARTDLERTRLGKRRGGPAEEQAERQREAQDISHSTHQLGLLRPRIRRPSAERSRGQSGEATAVPPPPAAAARPT